VYNTPLKDSAGTFIGYLSLLRDVTERKRSEEQLRATSEQLRALAARLQSAREDERTYVAREIHDELGQACTALKMDLVLLVQQLPKNKRRLHERAQSMVKLIDDMIHTLRRLASELRPGTLDDLGLLAAIEWQAQEFESRSGIKCHLALPQADIALDSDRSTAIFRIFQETLTNVARHANATRVNVRLVGDAVRLTLEVTDNGKGIDETRASAHHSLGLLGMRERALLLGGEFNVAGVPGQGTTVTVRVPLGG
jgi:signal transduction histidine kinase